jgi:hypothetical protein
MSFFNIVLIFALTFLVSCVIEVKDPPGLRDESVPNAFSAPTGKFQDICRLNFQEAIFS